MSERKKTDYKRPSYTPEFKAGAVRLIVEEGRAVSQVAQELGISQTALREWIIASKSAPGGDLESGALTSSERAELARLRRENRILTQEREILKKAGGLLRERESLRFAFVDAKKASWPIRMICRVLEVSASGYYAWRQRPESERSQEDRRLKVVIEAAHKRGRGAYGSPRVHAELKANGIKTSRKRVARLMKDEQLFGRPRRRWTRTTSSDPQGAIAENLLNQRFSVLAPDTAWVGDVTFLANPEGWTYLAVLLDLFSRKVVGWATSKTNDTALALAALNMAAQHRQPKPGLIHHTDRGSPYASADYRRRLTELGAVQSMSRKGNCYDNAVSESFFGTLKTELGERFESHSDAQRRLFDYIEVFYNGTRRHSAIGYQSPRAFERLAA
ncbi:IS3 family transposase [Myxococcota bacterium]|nr:IS3 family transposase [Myxococcota bacterium]